MKEKVSIIIPTFKRENKIVNAVENVLKQSYENLEIIVVNDNGEENSNQRDMTRKNLEKYIEKMQIKYVELKNNLGGAEARNEGIKNSTGEYISFFDDDDEYYEDKINLQVKYFEENREKISKLAFVKCEMQIIYNGIPIEETDTKKYFETDNLLKSHLLNLHGIVGTTSFLFDAKILKQIGGFENVSIRQEYSLILKILTNGYRGIHMPKCLVTLTGDGESITRTKNEKKVLCMNKVFEKRISYINVLSKSDIKKITADHFLDLAEWYCQYKKGRSLVYILRYIKISKEISMKIIKLFLKNILGVPYLFLRQQIKGY